MHFEIRARKILYEFMKNCVIDNILSSGQSSILGLCYPLICGSESKTHGIPFGLHKNGWQMDVHPPNMVL